MDLKQVLIGLESAKRQYQDLVTVAAEPLREQLIEAVRELSIKGLVWSQYTPHFNDGSECVFSVNEASLIFGGMPTDPYDEENVIELWYDWDQVQKYHGEELQKAGVDEARFTATKEFAGKLVSDGLEDVLQVAFGDHVYVIVTRNEVIVEEYDHD
jgi:hypothetical protein